MRKGGKYGLKNSAAQKPYIVYIAMSHKRSVNFPSGWDTFCHILSTFRQSGDFCHIQLSFPAVGRPSMNFHQLSDLPEDLSSTSINFPCHRVTLSPLPSTFRVARRPSVNISCSWEIFHQLVSNFSADGRPSVNIPCSPETFCVFP